MTERVLTEQDRHSACWLKLKAYYEERLALLRVQNDADLNDMDTAKLRGRIKEIRALLGLGEDKPVIVNDEDRFKD